MFVLQLALVMIVCAIVPHVVGEYTFPGLLVLGGSVYAAARTIWLVVRRSTGAPIRVSKLGKSIVPLGVAVLMWLAICTYSEPWGANAKIRENKAKAQPEVARVAVSPAPVASPPAQGEVAHLAVSPAPVAAPPAQAEKGHDGAGLDEYKRALLALIAKSKVYPAGWDPNSFSGVAAVAGAVDGITGRLMSVWLVKSSGRQDVDKAALQTIVRAAPFPPVGTSGVLRFQMAIRYGPETTDSPVTKASVTPTPDPEPTFASPTSPLATQHQPELGPNPTREGCKIEAPTLEKKLAWRLLALKRKRQLVTPTPDGMSAYQMDLKVGDIERAKYWAERGYTFDPETMSSAGMDLKVGDIERAKYWKQHGYTFDPDTMSSAGMDLKVQELRRTE